MNDPTRQTSLTMLPQNLDKCDEWPILGLDLEAVIASGWRPVPISEFVIKLSSRCNLSCDYCYVYTMADQSWRYRPRLIALDVLDQIGVRIAEHVQQHRLRKVRIVMHGGEPLLGGAGLIDQAASVIRKKLPAGVHLDLSIQTNGTLLDEHFMEAMRSHDIKIGISLDGSAAHNDKHRKRFDGRGSYALAVRALQLLNSLAYHDLFGGILCTIDVSNDPCEVYEALAEFNPPILDFLLPHGTWSTRPPSRDDSSSTPYANWLGTIFDRWFFTTHEAPRIRLFEEIIGLLRGKRSRSDQVGLSPAAFLVVDTDGSLQQVDALKASYAGAPETGLNVFDHTVDDALAHPAVIARQLGLAGLATQCQQCAIVAVCGGGHYPHRYQRGRGFLNPSVYCPDLQKLIEHISHRIGLGTTP
jgi:uncharacterized protein